MNWKLNFKKNTAVAKPKSKIREWIDAIAYAVLFTPRVNVTPRFKAAVTKPPPPPATEE